MTQYPALLDGEEGAYGITFPDLPGIAAMGETADEAIRNAAEALRDYALETELDGDQLITPSPPDTLQTPPHNQLLLIPLTPISDHTPAST